MSVVNKDIILLSNFINFKHHKFQNYYTNGVGYKFTTENKKLIQFSRNSKL